MEDNEDLEALFDSIVQANKAAEAVQETELPSTEQPEKQADQVFFSKIGQLTRSLFDALHQLGYDKSLEKALSSIPDANDRLSYVANLTEQAAERVLNATEIARPIQNEIGDKAKSLSAKWQKVYDNSLSVEEFKALAQETKTYLDEMPERIKSTNHLLTEIMMAQDFQDLTGQVIKKVVDIVRSVESQLLQLLLESSPKTVDTTAGSLQNGPVIRPEGKLDVVTNQAQVDELLESLGF
ncbi:MAG: protein phosphatase CheZ [Burkholderiales bacterium]|nr:protein phosphatase CheZ [Burkholderiales bacterium]